MKAILTKSEKERLLEQFEKSEKNMHSLQERADWMKNAVQYELKSEIEHLNEQLAIKRVREFAERFEK